MELCIPMIKELLLQDEGKTLEFKENTRSLAGIVKTVVAFANTAGGTIIFGIEDSTKKVVGLKDVLAEEMKLANAVFDSIAPLIIPDIEIQTYQDCEIIIMRVHHAVGPYYVKSLGLEAGTYIRLGSTNRCADEEMLYSLKLLAKNSSFDEKPNIKEDKDSLDWDLIKKTFDRVPKKIDEQKAESMGLLVLHRGQLCPTNGGIILFGKNRATLFPSAMIRCALFGSMKREHIIDSLDIQESLIDSIDIALQFIARNSRTAIVIEYLHHKKVPQYPPVALREALINAVVHADYANEGSSITVALFANRIEITNPGGLPCGLTLERALSGSSKLRNRVLGRVFRELELIEQWGSGLQRIVSSCEEHGLPEPLFEEIGNQFRVTIYSETLEKAVSQEWKKEVVGHLKKHKKISTKEAAELWDVTTRTAQNRLKTLMMHGTVIRNGTSPQDPYAHYYLAR